MTEIRSVFSWILIILVILVFFPLVALVFLFDWSGRYAHRMIRVWGRCVLWILGAKIEVHQQGTIDPSRGYVIVSNHESNADVMALLCFLPLDLKFVSKKSLRVIPIFGWAMAMGRYIFIERGRGSDHAKVAVASMAKKLDQGFSVLLFPEGTRSVDGKMRPFKKGAFYLAYDRAAEILPCAVVGGKEALPKGSWRFKKSKIALMIGQPRPIVRFEGSMEDLEGIVTKEASMVFQEVFGLRELGREKMKNGAILL